jgi:ectoine hydroxylase-related dioxygenase (phytanoyl-CoA dioxygenase family)
MTSPQSPREAYLDRGFYLHPEPVVPMALVQRARGRIPALIDEEYDTGLPPWRRWNVGDPRSIQKIDQIHLCDTAFHVLASQPLIGEWVARVTGADLVQLWATQLFLKPPGGGELGAIGWHTDRENWRFWEGEVLTVWLALADVGPDSGPLLYVDGSHLWPDAEKEGDAYTQTLGDLADRLQRRLPGREWREVPVLLRAGGLALHSADTVHGSGANDADAPRIGLAINVRTDQSRLREGVPDFGYSSHLENPFTCPIMYRRSP